MKYLDFIDHQGTNTADDYNSASATNTSTSTIVEKTAYQIEALQTLWGVFSVLGGIMLRLGNALIALFDDRDMVDIEIEPEVSMSSLSGGLVDSYEHMIVGDMLNQWDDPAVDEVELGVDLDAGDGAYFIGLFNDEVEGTQ